MFDIILPIFRIQKDILELCLDSILHQKNKNYTLWIVDGTPLDWEGYEGMKGVIDKYESQIDGMNYIRQSGKGVAQARNEAMKLGAAKYIAFIDGDDFWYPSHLGNIADRISQSDSNIVLWWDLAVYPLVMEEGKKMFIKQFDYENVVYCENLKEMLEEYIVLPSTSVISRARAEEVGWFDESLWGREDIDFYIRLAGENYGGEFIDKFGCIALWSTDGTKIDDFQEKDKLSGEILYSKHPDFNFEILREQINRRYVLIFDDNDEQYPNESVIDLCVETLPFNLSDANRLIQR